jgi:hypothetical protein
MPSLHGLRAGVIAAPPRPTPISGVRFPISSRIPIPFPPWVTANQA